MKYDDLLESVSGLAQQLTALNEQAVSLYRPTVEDLIRTDSRDQAAIERTLDGLLGFCGHDEALMLYRRLCRHFWKYHPEATARYINAYREMWDSEDEVETSSENSDSATRERQGASRRSDQNQSAAAPAAIALPLTAVRADPIRLFMTWTTYGTWLPGDNRGWRKEKKGAQRPQPLLEEWCRDQLKDSPVFLTVTQRNHVEDVIREHCEIRGWELGAVSARSNHVHVAVTVILPVSGKALAAGESTPVSGKALAAGESAPVSGKALAAGESAPVSGKALAAGESPTTNHANSSSALKRVRDQFKANGTRVLKKYPELSARNKIWTKGGDIQIIDTDDDWDQVLLYILVAQDRMERGK